MIIETSKYKGAGSKVVVDTEKLTLTFVATTESYVKQGIVIGKAYKLPKFHPDFHDWKQLVDYQPSFSKALVLKKVNAEHYMAKGYFLGKLRVQELSRLKGEVDQLIKAIDDAYVPTTRKRESEAYLMELKGRTGKSATTSGVLEKVEVQIG